MVERVRRTPSSSKAPRSTVSGSPSGSVSQSATLLPKLQHPPPRPLPSRPVTTNLGAETESTIPSGTMMGRRASSLPPTQKRQSNQTKTSLTLSLDNSVTSHQAGSLRRSSSLRRDSSLKLVVQFGGYHSAHVAQYMCARDARWRNVAPPSLNNQSVVCVPSKPIQFLWYKYDHIEKFPPVPLKESPPLCLTTSCKEELEAANVTRLSEDKGCCGSGKMSTYCDGLRTLQYTRIKFPPEGVCVVGCWEDCSAVWKKHLLWSYVQAWCEADPDARGSVRSRLPHTFAFDLHDPGSVKQCETYFTRLGQSVRALICKHSTGANGKGIRVVSSLAEAMKYITSSEYRKADIESSAIESGEKLQPSPNSKKSPNNDWWVIQEFVMQSPLIFTNRRFHMRMHTLAAVTPYSIELFCFHKARVQVCNEEFDPATFCDVQDAVVSNWFSQKKNKRFDTKTFYHMFEDLCVTYPQLEPVLPAARQIISDVYCAALTNGRDHMKYQMGCFEVLGFDFLVEGPDEGPWRPLMLEGNHRPGFAANRKFIETLFDDAISLVMFPLYPLKSDTAQKVSQPWVHIHTFVV